MNTLFKFQELFLNIQATAKTGKGTILTDDSVAGNNDGKRVFIVGHTHCPTCLGITNPYGNILIAGGLAKGDSAQFLPYFFLKRCAFRGDFQVKLLPVAGKIFGKLPEGCLKTCLIILPVFVNGCFFRLVGEIQRFENAVGADKQKSADGTIVVTVLLHDEICLFCRHPGHSPK